MCARACFSACVEAFACLCMHACSVCAHALCVHQAGGWGRGASVERMGPAVIRCATHMRKAGLPLTADVKAGHPQGGGCRTRGAALWVSRGRHLRGQQVSGQQVSAATQPERAGADVAEVKSLRAEIKGHLGPCAGSSRAKWANTGERGKVKSRICNLQGTTVKVLRSSWSG